VDQSDQFRTLSGLVVVILIPIVVVWNLLNAIGAGQRVKLRGLSGLEWMLYFAVFLFAQSNTQHPLFWDRPPAWLEPLVVRKGDPVGVALVVIAVLLVVFLAGKSLLRPR
jgi:hypothetical protein